MKIVLLENMKNLGFTGDIINVKNGYAKNYLIPSRKVLPAIKKNVKNLKYNIIFDKERKKIKELDNLCIIISIKTDSNGNIFKSIGKSNILRIMKMLKFNIRKNDILEDNLSIENTGDYNFMIKLTNNLFVKIYLMIISKYTK